MGDEKTPIQEAIDGLLKPLTYFRKYQRTRLAIINGEKLWDIEKQALDSRRLSSAWSFNLQEVFLAAIPINIVIGMLDFFFDTKTDAAKAAASLTEFSRAYENIKSSIDPMLSSLNAPLILTLSVYLLALGSLKDDDQQPSKIIRARRAYLYIDGAHGVWSQAGLSITTGLLSWIDRNSKTVEAPPIVSVVTFVVFAYCAFAQFYETYRKVPFTLFIANGYQARMPSILQSLLPFLQIDKDHDTDGPWDRYLTQMAICSGLIPLLPWISDRLSSSIAWVVANLKVAIS